MMRYQFNLEINICEIFVKSYGVLPSAKHIGKNVSKNISKKISGKYSQQIFVHAEQSGTDTFKTASKSKIQKTAESTIDWIENNKIADKIVKLSNISPQNNSETVTSEHDKKIHKENFHKNDKKLLMT